MTPEEKQLILQKAKQFFRDNIVENHKKKTEEAKHLKEFNPNPFLQKYLANFAFGNSDSKNIAKALIYYFWYSDAIFLQRRFKWFCLNNIWY